MLSQTHGSNSSQTFSRLKKILIRSPNFHFWKKTIWQKLWIIYKNWIIFKLISRVFSKLTNINLDGPDIKLDGPEETYQVWPTIVQSPATVLFKGSFTFKSVNRPLWTKANCNGIIFKNCDFVFQKWPSKIFLKIFYINDLFNNEK